MRQLLYQTILLGGLCSGAMDITAACISGTLRGGSAQRVLQSVAGGWLGRDTFQGGWKTAALGLAIHFVIATIVAAVYIVASLKLPVLIQYAIPCGVLYGIAVYLFMYGVVLPLSAFHSNFFAQQATAILTSVLIHIFCVGLPIALVACWRMK